eukprot:gene39646-48992_t
MLSTAYTVKNITDGWRKTGLVPYDPVKMLQHWPFYDMLDKTKSASLLKAISDLFVIAKHNGMLTEEQLTAHVGDIIGPPLTNYAQLKLQQEEAGRDTSFSSSDSDSDGDLTEYADGSGRKRKRPRVRKALNDRPINHQRAVWLNNPRFIADQRERRDKRETAALEKAAKARVAMEQKEAKKAETLAKQAAKEEKQLTKALAAASGEPKNKSKKRCRVQRGADEERQKQRVDLSGSVDHVKLKFLKKVKDEVSGRVWNQILRLLHFYAEELITVTELNNLTEDLLER